MGGRCCQVIIRKSIIYANYPAEYLVKKYRASRPPSFYALPYIHERLDQLTQDHFLLWGSASFYKANGINAL